MVFLRWLGKNVSTLLLALVLALVVWVSSVTAADPNQEQVFPRPVDIEFVGKDPGLKLMGKYPTQVRVTLTAPRSRWTELISAEQPVRAVVDLSGLEAGEYMVPVQARVANISPVRVVQVTPSEIQLQLEPLVTRTFPINLIIDGEPALGYQAGDPIYSPEQVVLTGAESQISRVAEVRAYMDISGAIQPAEAAIPLEALDENGELVNGITLIPEAVNLNQPINLLGGYRNVIVKVVYTGKLADGYKLTNITVSPPAVVVFSSDLQLLSELPGYIETVPLDLTGVRDDVEAFLELDQPAGIDLPANQKVLVQVSVAAIESNLAVSLPVEVVGVQRGLSAQVAPTTVDIIFSGPLPVLNTLKPSDIRVVVDLTGREVGTYQIIPSVTFLPDRVQIESILPASLEVTISPAPTPTATSTPTSTPLVSPTPAQTPRPTP